MNTRTRQQLREYDWGYRDGVASCVRQLRMWANGEGLAPDIAAALTAAAATFATQGHRPDGTTKQEAKP